MSKSSHAVYLIIIGVLLITVIVLVMPRSTNISGSPQILPVVVFPIQASSPGSEQYATRLTVEVLHALNGQPNIRIDFAKSLPVELRTSAKHHLWPDEYADYLILEGQVAIENSGIRVTVQLVRAASDDDSWTSTYNLPDFDTAGLIADLREQISALADP